jgi:uncharacterized protein
MTNFIPIFPLELVVYPGEKLNLHIFEPRYKQLINECLATKKMFGIPAVIDKKMQDYGTLMEVTELVSAGGKAETPGSLGRGGGDIKTRGVRIFRILEIIRNIPDKLYSGAIVNYPVNRSSGYPHVMKIVLNHMKEMYRLLGIKSPGNFRNKTEFDLTSYDVAHHIGLSAQEEYELLCLEDERQRQEYIKIHLAKIIPVIAETEKLKEKIKLNGHFKNLGGFDLGK